VKNFSVTSFLFLFLPALVLASGGEMHLQSAKKVYELTLAKNKGDKTKTSLTLVSKWGKKEFFADREWIAFLDFCEQQAKAEKQNGYAEVCFRIGENLDLNGFPHEAFVYLIKSEDLLKNKSAKQVPFFYEFHNRIGMVYFSFQRYSMAEKHFRILIDGSSPYPIEIGACNSIGLIYREKNDALSKHYFERAMKLARKHNRQDWIGILSGNLGNYYYNRNNFKRARELVGIDFKISSETGQWESAINALALLAELDVRAHLRDSAILKLKQTKELMKAHFHTMHSELNFYKAKTMLGETTNDYRMAYDNQKLYLAYQDSINEQQNLENFHNAEFQIQFQKKQAQLKLLDAQKKRVEQRFLLLAVIGCFVIVGLIIVLRQIVLRRRKEKEVLVLQKLRAEDELTNIEKQMHQVLSNLSEKNKLVYELQSEIEQFNKDSGNQLTAAEREALSDRLQTFKLLTEDDWDVFRKLFEKLNPGFFDNFQKLADTLSKADLRLAALIRMDLSTFEIARLLGISTDSVKRTDLRLRKKLSIEQSKELIALVKSI
jgi:DNA-binding CsgD family transcriptional regulator